MDYLKTGCVVLFFSLGLGYSLFWTEMILQTEMNVPDIRVEWWAAGPAKTDDKRIRPFSISFPQEDINELKQKLSLTSLMAPPLEGIEFQYGFNTKYLSNIIDFWKTKYNWTEREAYLNQFPQFKTQIGGLDIHFLHVKPDQKASKGKKVLPLLLVHGWPGSVREFYDLIPLLTTPREQEDFVFEVIAPSLPGYGFSDKAAKVGCGPPQMAVIFVELMARLGFHTFHFQGGDWGSIIGHAMSVIYPKRVLSFHCNFCLVTTTKSRLLTFIAWLFPSVFVENERQQFFQDQFFDSFIFESGYYHIQATKPDTIGAALTDSPAGLAAYILEKFSTLTNKTYRSLSDGGLEKFNKVDLLDNIMIYWLTKTITTAMRIYSENYVEATHTIALTSIPVQVPTHCARFANEVLFFPKFALQAQYSNLISVSDFTIGGHFAAFEEPKIFAEDIYSFIRKLRNLKNS